MFKCIALSFVYSYLRTPRALSARLARPVRPVSGLLAASIISLTTAGFKTRAYAGRDAVAVRRHVLVVLRVKLGFEYSHDIDAVDGVPARGGLGDLEVHDVLLAARGDGGLEVGGGYGVRRPRKCPPRQRTDAGETGGADHVGEGCEDGEKSRFCLCGRSGISLVISVLPCRTKAADRSYMRKSAVNTAFIKVCVGVMRASSYAL